MIAWKWNFQKLWQKDKPTKSRTGGAIGNFNNSDNDLRLAGDSNCSWRCAEAEAHNVTVVATNVHAVAGRADRHGAQADRKGDGEQELTGHKGEEFAGLVLGHARNLQMRDGQLKEYYFEQDERTYRCWMLRAWTKNLIVYRMRGAGESYEAEKKVATQRDATPTFYV